MLTLEKQLADWIRKTTVEWRDVLTDFMPREKLMAEHEMLRQCSAHCLIDGGYDEAQRVRLYMTMFEEEPTRMDMQIGLIAFRGNMRFVNFSHRDCLGALMALGFERRCIGDIIVREDGFDVLTNSKIDDFLVMSELSIRQVRLKPTKVSLENWQPPKPELKNVIVLVAQLRLDAIIAKVFNLSRGQATAEIRAGLVQVNHEIVTNASRQCKEGAVISVRGKGKFILADIEGLSKSGKTKLLVSKYV